MAKSPDAFRTISEVADWLGVQAHVLRFWESKFSQVKPVKRAGGRRYYRPNDMLLLGGIRQLLHVDGLTIKGVQKVLREEGISHVAALSQPLDELTQSQIEDSQESPFIEATPDPAEETGVVLEFGTPGSQSTAPREAPKPESAAPEAPAPEAEAPAPEVEDAAPAAEPPVAEPQASPPKVAEPATAPETPPAPAELPAFLRRPMATQPAATDNPPAEGAPQTAEKEAAAPPAPEQAPAAPPSDGHASTEVEAPETTAPDAPAPVEKAKPKPRIIDVPALEAISTHAAAPSVLSAAYRARRLSPAQAKEVAPLLDRLAELRDSMAARRNPGGQAGPNS